MPAIKQKQSLNQSLSPQQILQTLILQLNTNSLEDKVFEELESNPLLEHSDGSDEEETFDSKDDIDYEDDPDEYEPHNIYSNESNKDDIPIVEQLDFLQDLSKQLNEFNLSKGDESIAEEIIWNLDENGYFTLDAILIADRLNVSSEKVEEILFLVQKLNPPGIGARNLKECLILQIPEKKYENHRMVLSEHFEDFVNHKYEKIVDALGIHNEELHKIINDIKRLNPYPGEGKLKGHNDSVIPDLIITLENNKWKISVNDSWVSNISLNTKYLEAIKNKKSSKETKKYLSQKFDSATWLIQAIEQRQSTLTRVMEEIINNQSEFFNGDTSLIRPMKLKDIANKLNMDISTISRSTRNKYVDTPYGIFELKSFFSGKLNSVNGEEVSIKLVKNLLKQLIRDEVKQEPLTDTDLAIKLKEKGYPIARRTVAKYREELKLPVARLRRQITN
jgi:RNA polymerase sigma-54 factor|tara:strand:- start:1655 stop:2998 length:1344 start_codon:yes stop_codon:yes gene_type:complete